DYITMNYLVKPFDNINIRKALYMALNRQVIMQATYKGSRPATNHIIPTGMPGSNPNITDPSGSASTTGDVTKAKSYLQAGLKEMGLSSASQLPTMTLTYETGSPDLNNEIAAIVQQWQSNLGVTVKLSAVSFETLVTQTAAMVNNPKGLQMYALGWVADYPDPQDWTTLLFGKGSVYNQPNYGINSEQQANQAAMAAADADQSSPTVRYAKYYDIEQKLINDAGWIPMDQRTVTRLTKAYVKGIVYNAADTHPPDDWGNVYIAAH
ncbi:MAG: ABC transporter substrate-binding protein, partial [Chloroflexota bacterium]|nr:ABC transporter substrate-binding protein [Chloroflexota bacterium]